MSEILISFVLNIVLAIIIVSLVFGPKVIQWYTKHKKLREKRYITRIQGIVRDYLEELKND